MARKILKTYFLRISEKFEDVLEFIKAKESMRDNSEFMRAVFKEYFLNFDKEKFEEWNNVERQIKRLTKKNI